jgi:hypothetical protein
MSRKKGRVGRHTRQHGSHCQNDPQDQEIVMDLLNRIPIASGGAGGALKGPIKSGVCSDDLYRAISKFEDKYFPGQRSGFVDPGGAMLKRMEELAVPKKLMIVDKQLAGKWSAGERVHLDRLVAEATQYVDDLKRLELDGLAIWDLLFGTASVAPSAPFATEAERSRIWSVAHMRMHRGTGLTWKDEIRTWQLPALILFQDGTVAVVAKDQQIAVTLLHEITIRGRAASHSIP